MNKISLRSIIAVGGRPSVDAEFVCIGCDASDINLAPAVFPNQLTIVGAEESIPVYIDHQSMVVKPGEELTCVRYISIHSVETKVGRRKVSLTVYND